MTIKAKRTYVDPEHEQYVRDRDVFSGTHGTTMFDAATTHVEPNAKGHKPVFDFSLKSRAYFTSRPANPAADEGNYYSDYSGDNRGALGPEHEGWTWAEEASMAKGREHGYRERPVVHDVVPEGRIESDKHFRQNTNPVEFTADRLRITNTHWTPPPSAGEHSVQGTLPHINWNQFGPTYTSVYDAPELNFTRNRAPVESWDYSTGRPKPTKWPNPDETKREQFSAATRSRLDPNQRSLFK